MLIHIVTPSIPSPLTKESVRVWAAEFEKASMRGRNGCVCR